MGDAIGASVRDRGLRRRISGFALAAVIVNGVVGGGIFSLPANMMQAAGPYAFAAYLLCALAMAGVVLCFAEAGSRVPTSGGTYGYVEEAFGPLAGFVAGMLLWLSCALSVSGISVSLADTLGTLTPVLRGPVAHAAIILATLGSLLLVNLAGVGPASRLVAAITTVKLLPLFLFVGVAFWHADPANLRAGDMPGVSGIGRAILLSLFAFQGMETGLAASGEVAEPARTVPRALILAMLFVTLFYIAIQLGAQGLLGPALAGSKAPLADAMARVDPRLGTVLLIGTAVSLLGFVGGDLLGAPRVLFAFARDGFLPAILSRLSARHVPANAIMAHASIAALLALTGSFERLAVLSALAGCALYIAGCAAAWKLHRDSVAEAGVPLGLPGLGFWAVLGIASMVAAILLGQWSEIAGLVGAILLSIALYTVTAKRR